MMQQLNEDFLDVLDNKDIISDNVEVTDDNGTREPDSFKFWITMGVHGYCTLSNYNREEIRQRTERVLKQCTQVTAWSKVYMSPSNAFGWESGIKGKERDHDEPLSFAFDATFKSGLQVWRFLDSLHFIFNKDKMIDLCLTVKDSVDEIFFDYSDYATIVETQKMQKSDIPLKKIGIAPSPFKSLCTIIDAMLEQTRDPILEADKVLGGVDYSREFRSSVEDEFIQKLCFNGRRSQTAIKGRISDINQLFEMHVPIKQIQKMNLKDYSVILKVAMTAALSDFAVPLLLDINQIKDEYDDYVGLTEIQPSTFNIKKLEDKLHTSYMCIIYGGDYRNNHGVMVHVALAIGASSLDKMKRFLEDLFQGISFEFFE